MSNMKFQSNFLNNKKLKNKKKTLSTFNWVTPMIDNWIFKN